MNRTRAIITIDKIHYKSLISEIKRCEFDKHSIKVKYLDKEPVRAALAVALPHELKLIRVLGFDLSKETNSGGESLYLLTVEFVSKPI